MTSVLFGIGALIWLFAAYALVRIVASGLKILGAAPAGERTKAALELWSLNFPAVRQRIGEAADGPVRVFSRHIGMFAASALALVALVIVNAVSGNAA